MSEPLDLASIRAREQAATPGDWTAVEAIPADGTDQAMWSIDQPGWLEGDDHSYMTRADAEFLANARIDVAALLAEVDRLRALVVAHHFYGKALPLGQLCPVCVEHGCAHPEHDRDAALGGGEAGA